MSCEAISNIGTIKSMISQKLKVMPLGMFSFYGEMIFVPRILLHMFYFTCFILHVHCSADRVVIEIVPAYLEGSRVTLTEGQSFNLAVSAYIKRVDDDYEYR